MKFLYSLLFIPAFICPVDLMLVGYHQWADGLGRIPFSIVDCIKETGLTWSTISTRWVDKSLYDKLYFERLSGPINKIGVAILTDAPWYPGYEKYKLVPSVAKIKLAYSVFESDSLPKEWVKIFNENFDGIITTDQFEKDSYKKAGVNIPIFVLPNPFYIEPFFDVQPRRDIKPFIFGFSGGLWGRKNCEKLVQAFKQEFADNPDVQLKIHTRFKVGVKTFSEKFNLASSANIELIEKEFSQEEYIQFMSGLNCYVSVSKGEGFSIGPREALAMGVPAIVTNSTAQKNICDSGCVLSVECKTKEPAYYEIFRSNVGRYDDCSIEDIQIALRQMYANYEFYCKKSGEGKEWAKKYSFESLKSKFQTLIRPSQVVFAEEDIIEYECIKTSNRRLLKKYRKLIGQR